MALFLAAASIATRPTVAGCRRARSTRSLVRSAAFPTIVGQVAQQRLREQTGRSFRAPTGTRSVGYRHPLGCRARQIRQAQPAASRRLENPIAYRVQYLDRVPADPFDHHGAIRDNQRGLTDPGGIAGLREACQEDGVQPFSTFPLAPHRAIRAVRGPPEAESAVLSEIQ